MDVLKSSLLTTVKRSYDRREIAGAFLLVLFFLAMAIWSWRKWADPLVDFGVELYIPWQIASGKVLYRDIVHLFGPFSQYFNAILFKLFGVSYTTLIFANLALTFLFTLVVYKIFKESADHLCATFAAFVFLSLFAFSQYTGISNYNFISPYAHEATHGIIMAALMIYSLGRFASLRQNRHIIVSGLLFGLVLLTKVEIIISTAATVAVYFVMLFKHGEMKRPFWLKATGLFFIAAIAPPAVFFMYFLACLPPGDALKATGGALYAAIMLLKLGVAGVPFYQISMGTDNLTASLSIIFKTLLWFLIIIAIGIVPAIRFNHQKYIKNDKYLFVLFLIIMIILAWKMEWVHIGRPLPLFSLFIGVALFAAFEKKIVKDRKAALKDIPLVLWSVFSFFLLIKIFFNGRLYHYGFYQAMPAFLLLVCFLTGYVPRWLDFRNLRGDVFRVFMTVFIGIVMVHHLLLSDSIYRAKTLSIGDGHDRFYTFSPQINIHGLAVFHFLKWATELPADSTFAVLPEGVMLNYLSRKTNPTKYLNFMTTHTMLFKENIILSDFMDKRPDFIVLVHKDTRSECGGDFFGRSERYGKTIMDWVNRNYQGIVRIGDEPLQNDDFGIKILKRKD